MLGYDVGYNDNTRTISLTSKQSPTPTPTPVPVQGKIYNKNETFTDGKFSITLVNIYKKSNEVTVCEFEFKNDSGKEVSDYVFGTVTFGHNSNRYPKDTGGLLWYSDTDTAVISYYPNDKGKVKLQFVSELDGYKFIPKTLVLKGNEQNITWNIETK